MHNHTIISDNAMKTLALTGIGAAIILVCGSYFAPLRAWSNLLLVTFYLLTIGLGGTVFLALTFVTGAGWHVAFRRVPEAMAMIVPIAGAAVVVVLSLRMLEYGWVHHGGGDAGTFWFKQLWLTPWFWILAHGAVCGRLESIGWLAR